MGKECTMPEVLKVTDEREDGFELNLELSIGGSYGKKSGDLNKMEGKTRDPFEEKEKVLMINDVGLLKTDFSCGKRGDVGGGENGCEFMDLQRKRESQVLKRQEACKTREEKINKSFGSKGLSSGGFAVDKLFLESQQLQARVQDREMRENDGFPNRKRGKKGTDEVGKDLNLSSFKEDKISGANISRQQMQMQCLFPQVQYVPLSNGIAYYVVPSMGPNVGKVEKNEGNLFGSLACKNAWACHGNGNSPVECDLEQSNVENACGNRQTVSNGSLEQSSSAVSDYHSTTQKGESGSDTGSHSSPLCSNLHSMVPRSNLSGHLESNNTYSQAQLKHQRVMSIPQSSTSKSSEKSKPDNHSNQTTNTCSTPENRTCPTLKETRVGLIERPPKPPNNHHGIASVSHMPCVSTTGNGPNAKTIMGFLYKYTKTEVSIMCVCHGSSFTPAGFVEHAGGVDIAHPMRHITIVPSATG